MKAILVVNHFLRSKKFSELHNHLKATAAKMDIDLKVNTNLELACKKAEGDFVLFWDKDVNLARRLERQGFAVFNSADSIEKCDDKARTYIELDGVVPQPESMIAPLMFSAGCDISEFVTTAIERLSLPLVFKECFGSFGEQVYLCNSYDEIISHITQKPFILQKFIGECAGEDMRIEVVGSKAVCAVKRKNENDFRSNVTNGGTMVQCTPSQRDADNAVEACKRLGLSFGGVDILPNGMVCEVNSNAHIINIMKATGIDTAELIFSAIEEQIK